MNEDLAHAACQPSIIKFKAALRAAHDEGRLDDTVLKLVCGTLDQVYGLGFCEGVIHAANTLTKEGLLEGVCYYPTNDFIMD